MSAISHLFQRPSLPLNEGFPHLNLWNLTRHDLAPKHKASAQQYRALLLTPFLHRKAMLQTLLSGTSIQSRGCGMLITLGDFIDVSHRCSIAANKQFSCVRGESWTQSSCASAAPVTVRRSAVEIVLAALFSSTFRPFNNLGLPFVEEISHDYCRTYSPNWI